MDDDGRLFLPAPVPAMVHAARAYLTPRHAAGVDELLWEEMDRPLSDLAAIGAVIAASDLARRSAAEPIHPVEIAAALVVLGAARLDMDQMEARLLDAAQDSVMGWEQIAAILDLSVEAAEERHRSLKSRLDEPVDEVPPPRLRGIAATGEPARRNRRAPAWHEPAGEGRDPR